MRRVSGCVACTAESSRGGPDCSRWLTHAFWQAAAAEDAERCLAVSGKVDARDKGDSTPLDLAARSGIAAVVNGLLQGESRSTPLLLALRWKGSADTVNALIAAGANGEGRDSFGRTPLHYAAANGRAESIIAVLDSGASAATRTDSGDTAFDLARIY